MEASISSTSSIGDKKKPGHLYPYLHDPRETQHGLGIEAYAYHTTIEAASRYVRNKKTPSKLLTWISLPHSTRISLTEVASLLLYL